MANFKSKDIICFRSYIILYTFLMSMQLNASPIKPRIDTLKFKIWAIPEQKPLQGVTVLTKNRNKIISYQQSDIHGICIVNLHEEITAINFSLLGFQKQDVLIDGLDEIPKQQGFTIIKLDRDTIRLGEIVVNNKQHNTDLEISKMNLSQNSPLREALQRSTKIRLEGNEIIYNNKLINKILINKREAFVNQNKVALDEIKANIIESAEIIDHYDEGFELSFTEKDEAVLNINSKHENLILPAADIGIGVNNAYKAKASGFLFGNFANVSLTTNTNAIENISVDPKDFNKIMLSSGEISEKQNDIIQQALNENKSLNSSFISNNTLSFHKKNDRFKVGGYLAYHKTAKQLAISEYLYPSSEINTPISQREINKRLKMEQLLFSLPIATKITATSVAELNTTFSLLSQKSNDFTTVVLDSVPLERMLHSTYNIQTFYSRFRYQKKVNNSIILTSATALNSYFDHSNAQAEQRLKLLENTASWSQNFDMHIKVNERLHISGALNWRGAKDKYSGSVRNDERNTNAWTGYLTTNMENLGVKNLKINIGLGLQMLQQSMRTHNGINQSYPYTAKVKYNIRNNYLTFESNDTTAVLSFNSFFDKLNQGDKYIHGLADYNVWTYRKRINKFQYTNSNFLKQLLFGFNIAYQESLNQPKYALTNIGLADFDSYYTFINPYQGEMQFNSFISKLFFDKYPIKSTLRLSALNTTGYMEYNNEKMLTHYSSYSTAIMLESLADYFMNFSYSNSLAKERHQNGVFINQYHKINNELKINFKNAKKSFFFNIGMKMDYNWIAKQSFKRTNFNIQTEYFFNKKLSVQLDAYNIDEYLSIFDNSSYYNMLQTSNGVNMLTSYPASIKYIILSLKYNL